MDIVLWINLSISLVGLFFILKGTLKGSQKSTTPAISSTHTLVKVWENMSVEHSRKGWWIQCSCGLSCPSNATGNTSYGSERSAIDTFKTHASLHRGLEPLTVNPFEKKYNDEVAAFVAYRAACYCKDTNDDLLVLKHRHP